MSAARIVQGMLVAKYRGTGKSNALEVFRIPESEHDAFFAWLAVADAPLCAKLRQSAGFVKLGSRKQMQAVGAAYRLVRPGTRVGWQTVPMQSNSVVLWVGPHRVTPAKCAADSGCFRSALYLNLQAQPGAYTLPPTADAEDLSRPTTGKAVNTLVDAVVGETYEADGRHYGWNQESIAAQYHHMFAYTPHHKQPYVPLRDPDEAGAAADTPLVAKLREDGFVVMTRVLPDHLAEQLHVAIVETTRTILFRVPREGMCAELRTIVLGWSADEFAQHLNEPVMKKAKYFKRGTVDLYCGYELPEDESRRMCNLQGVSGVTLSSQMVDAYSVPYFAYCLAQLHRHLKRSLGVSLLYFGKERCSLRSYMSAPLETHIDEPVSRVCVHG